MNNIAFIPNRNNISFQRQLKTKEVNKQDTNTIVKTKAPNKTIIGAAIVSAFIGGGINNVYNNYQAKSLMNDMMEEYKQDDTKSLKIEDLNDDNSPEIILEKTDGTQCVYDVKNNTVHYKVDDDMIEKIR